MIYSEIKMSARTAFTIALLVLADSVEWVTRDTARIKIRDFTRIFNPGLLPGMVDTRGQILSVFRAMAEMGFATVENGDDFDTASVRLTEKGIEAVKKMRRPKPPDLDFWFGGSS